MNPNGIALTLTQVESTTSFTWDLFSHIFTFSQGAGAVPSCPKNNFSVFKLRMGAIQTRKKEIFALLWLNVYFVTR